MFPPVQPGDILAGKYVVERVLGTGGMGVVVSATHQRLGQRVAVKFLLEELLHNQEAVARFLREAQAAVQVQSEHVARVIDVGTLDSGAPYMVVEHLSGRDLAGELGARGELPVAEAVSYILQACEAVAEAHAIGMVHRDLKPANLFVTTRADGTPMIKVLDFGISRALPQAGGAQSLTSTQSVMGSPLYMSPEQLRSTKNVDQRTDVWALGVILHELLAGSPPFKSDTVSGLIATVVTEPPPPLRALRHDVPEELEHLVLGCLEKDVADRIPHVGVLATRLQPFSPRQAEVSVPRITGVLENAGYQTQRELAGAASATAAGVQTGFGHVAPARKATSPTPWLAALGGIGVLGALGVGLVVSGATRGQGEDADTTAAEPADSGVLGERSATPPTVDSETAPSSPTQSASAAAPPLSSSSAPLPPPATAPAAKPPVPTAPPRATATPARTPSPRPPAPRPRPAIDPLDGRH